MMLENYIQVLPHSLTRGLHLSSAFILLLQEKEGKRFLPLVLQEEENELIELALDTRTFPSLKTMLQLAQTLRLQFEYVVLSNSTNDTLKASAMFLDNGRMRSVTYSSATGVLLSLACRIPLLVPRTLFESRFSKHAGEGNVAIPIAAMSETLLREALQTSIKEERFELSRLLSDELDRRGLSPIA